MSHTIGQVKQDNQQSNSNASQDSQKPEEQTSNQVSPLADGDYEFLFNQLLEGIAHGWHDQRIIKFFNQLGDRGKQEDWIVWLERLRLKVITLPIQSKRQLGTMMIRLGELTQSASEVSKIGATSNRIGRELLFGNTEDIVWEYVGPDFIEDAAEVETEEELSERLPTDFAALGSATIKATETDLASESSIAENQPITDTDDDLLTAAVSALDSISPTADTVAIFADQATESSLPVAESNLATDAVEESEVIPASKDLNSSSEATVLDSEEFEFELSQPVKEKPRESGTEKSAQDSQENDLLSAVESIDDQVAESVRIQQVMSLIQTDEELAQQISQKLNLSVDNLEFLSTQQSQTIQADNTSGLELIESWFNLGLKQVSAGEFTKAIASWEKALEINPNLSEAWHNRGSALGRLGQYKQAVESFQNALKIDPQNYQAWNDRAHALYQLENWSEAVTSWGNALKIMPANHLFWYNRGCGLEQLENWAEAIVSYEKSLEIKPDFQPARSRYINLVADNSRSN